MSKIAQLQEKMVKVQEEMEDAGAEALGQDSVKYWAEIPKEVESLTWEQYTDYFNDGEECCFSVHCDANWGIVLNEATTISDIRYSRDLESESDEEKALADAAAPNGDTCKGIKAFCEFIESIEDFLEQGIGDHKQVTVFRTGEVKVEDYTEHD